MINNLAIPVEWRVLMEYLEQADIRNEIKTIPLQISDFSESSLQIVKEVLYDLGSDYEEIEKQKFSFSVIHLFETNKHFVFEPDFFYNRYRLITFRSPLYDNFQPLDIQKARNFCRTKEKEAIKSGLQNSIWNHSAEKAIFGASEEAGDFTGSGSAGWKYIAFCNFLIDLYFYENKFFFKRITPFDSLMKDSKIIQISAPIKLKDDNFKSAIQKYICRILNVGLPKS